MARRKHPTESDPRICDPKCVYAERVRGIPSRKGAHVYFLHWWGFNPNTGRDGWRGQIFHNETTPADGAASMAKGFGDRTWCVLDEVTRA